VVKFFDNFWSNLGCPNNKLLRNFLLIPNLKKFQSIKYLVKLHLTFSRYGDLNLKTNYINTFFNKFNIGDIKEEISKLHEK